jgi:hypothetical protein
MTRKNVGPQLWIAMHLGQQGLNPSQTSLNSIRFPWPAAVGMLCVGIQAHNALGINLVLDLCFCFDVAEKQTHKHMLLH